MAASQAAVVGDSGSRDGAKGRFQVGLEMEKILQPDQLDGLHDPGVAHNPEIDPGIVALLRQEDEGAETRGINEINPAQIQHQGQGVGAAMIGDEVLKLLLGIGVQLSSELEQLTTVLPLKAAAQRHGQSLQVRDGSNPPLRGQSREV